MRTRRYRDRQGAVDDQETLGGRTALLGGTYVTKDDPVANGAAAIRAVAEAAILNPATFAQFNQKIDIPAYSGSDNIGARFTVTVPGLSKVSGYVASVAPFNANGQNTDAWFLTWNPYAAWPPPANVLQLCAQFNNPSKSFGAGKLTLYILAWGTA